MTNKSVMTKQENIPFAVEIQVKNLEKSIKFYKDVLGFFIIRQKEDNHNKFAALSFNNSILNIAEVSDLPEPRGVGIQLRFILSVKLEDYYEEIKKRGAVVSREIQERYYGLKTFSVNDPDGFEIKFANTLDIK